MPSCLCRPVLPSSGCRLVAVDPRLSGTSHGTSEVQASVPSSAPSVPEGDSEEQLWPATCKHVPVSLPHFPATLGHDIYTEKTRENKPANSTPKTPKLDLLFSETNLVLLVKSSACVQDKQPAFLRCLRDGVAGGGLKAARTGVWGALRCTDTRVPSWRVTVVGTSSCRLVDAFERNEHFSSSQGPLNLPLPSPQSECVRPRRHLLPLQCYSSHTGGHCGESLFSLQV